MTLFTSHQLTFFFLLSLFIKTYCLVIYSTNIYIGDNEAAKVLSVYESQTPSDAIDDFILKHQHEINDRNAVFNQIYDYICQNINNLKNNNNINNLI